MAGHRRSKPARPRPPARDGRPAGCLTLAELEPLAGLRTARLLALDRARVAREEPEVAQLAAVRLVDLEQRASDREAQCAGLAGDAATLEVRLHVIAPERVGRRERLLDRRHQRRPREVVAERAPVDVPLARTSLQVHTADRFLPAADAVDRIALGHLLRLALLEVQSLRLLREVRMLGARIDTELEAQLLAAEGVLREHPVDGLLDHALGVLLDHLGEW